MAKSATKYAKIKLKINDLWKKYFTSKEISSDHNYPFNFKNANWYITVVYLISFIAVPIIYSLIKTYAFHVRLVNGSLANPWNKIDFIARYLVPIIGMMIAFAVDWKAMVKRGAWTAYTNFIFLIISSFFVNLLIQTGFISVKSFGTSSKVMSALVQMIIQFIGCLVIIFINKPLRKQIVATLKEAKLDLLIWILIFLAIVGLLNLMFNIIFNSVNNINNISDEDSINQNNIIALAKTPLGIFVLILGSVFIVPVSEEISYRYGTFSIVRHKWLGFTASLIYFPAIHILGNDDWNHFFDYLAPSIAAPLLFVCTKGNTTYTIGLHMLLNLIATISLFARMKWLG